LRDRSLSSSAVLGGDLSKPSDIINPITGQPLVEQQACVVIASTATKAEMLSTAFLSMGKGSAAAYLPNFGADTQAAWLSTTGLEWLNSLPPT
jgi:thiamine biosynthesis lipoprotein ApbE